MLNRRQLEPVGTDWNRLNAVCGTFSISFSCSYFPQLEKTGSNWFQGDVNPLSRGLT